MEVAGFVLSVVSLASLAESCVDLMFRAESLINANREQLPLMGQLEANRIRLERWRAGVGLDSAASKAQLHPKLQRSDVQEAIGQMLTGLQELFQAGHYSTSDPGHFQASAVVPDAGKRTTTVNRFKWAFGGGKRRVESAVARSTALVQSLYDLLDPDKEERNFNAELAQDLLKTLAMLRLSTLPGSEDEPLPPTTPTSTEDLIRVLQGERLRAWLSAKSSETGLRERLLERQPGTATWLFENKTYCRWNTSNPYDRNRIFWLQAPGGYGKSVICAATIDKLVAEHKTVLYYFCSASHGEKDVLTTIIASLIYQLALKEEAALDVILEEMQLSGPSQRSAQDLWGIFERCISRQETVIVIDGLDEIPRSSPILDREYVSLRTQLVDQLLLHTSSFQVQVMVCSRDEADIREALFESCSTHECEILEHRITTADLASDIHLYAKAAVNSRLRKSSDSLKDDIVQRLTQKGDGMFLLVKLQTSVLRDTRNTSQLLRNLEYLPEGLDLLFERDWSNIVRLPKPEQICAIRLLTLLSLSRRQLQISELTSALQLSVEQNMDVSEDYIKEELAGLCGSLLELQRNAKTETIGFSHFTAKEYILKKLPLHENMSLEQIENTVLGQTCLKCLLETPEQDEPLKFLDYSTRYWFRHLSLTTLDDGTYQCINRFFSRYNTTWTAWRDRYEWYEYQTSLNGSPEYYAAHFGLTKTMEHMQQERHCDWKASGGLYGCPLQAGCMISDPGVLDFLLEQDINVNQTSGLYGCAINAAAATDNLGFVKKLRTLGAALNVCDERGNTALHLTAEKGFIAVTRWLIENEPGSAMARNSDGDSPLHLAAKTGSRDVVNLLCQYGADLNGQNRTGETPLYVATICEHTAVAKLLITKGADPSIGDLSEKTPQLIASQAGNAELVQIFMNQSSTASSGTSALHQACVNNHRQVVEVLLSHGVSLESTDRYERTPLVLAAEYGHFDIVQLLLDRGANINGGRNPTETALLFAADRGHTNVVRLLLERGANLAQSGITPLRQASQNGHLEIAKLLLAKGAKADGNDEREWTALMCAASENRLAVVKELLDHGVYVDAIEARGWTALMLAAQEGHHDVVTLLLAHRAEPDRLSHDAIVALNIAAEHGRTAVVLELLAKGAKIELHGKSGVTALRQASQNGHDAIVRILLDRGADVNVTDDRFWTPLAIAAEQGRLSTMRLLLARGANVNVRDNIGWSPLHKAAREGHVEGMKILVDYGADLAAVTLKNESCALLAADRGNLACVQFILNRRPGLASVAADGGITPLRQASQEGHLEVVQLLLDHGVDAGFQDNGGWTPIAIASSSGRLEVVKLLISRGVDVNITEHSGWSPILLASEDGWTDIVEVLLEHGADPLVISHEGITPIMISAVKGHLEVVKLLIKQKVNVEIAEYQSGATALRQAAQLGALEIVKLLLEQGAAVNRKDNCSWTPLCIAAQKGHGDVVKHLLHCGADPSIRNDAGHTPIIVAADFGQTAIVAILLDHGVRLEGEDCGMALVFASDKGHASTVEQLLSAGVNIESPYTGDVTALRQASQNGHLDVVNLLLDRGALVGNPDNKGWTALIIASQMGHVEVIRTLLVRGASVLDRDERGWTALHIACQEGHYLVVRLLLDWNADPQARTREGYSCSEIAAAGGHAHVVDILLARGSGRAISHPSLKANDAALRKSDA